MKYKSALVTTASGSVNGLTASHNRGGQYFRARTKPVDPGSSRQNTMRASFTGAVVAWTSTCSNAQRAAWKAYADAVQVINTLGDPHFLTGQQQFIRSNSVRDQFGLPLVLDGPTIFNTGEVITAIEDPENDDLNQIQLSPPNVLFDFFFSAPLTAAGDILMFFGDPINESINFFKGPYQASSQVPDVDAAATTKAVSVPAAILGVSPALADGQFRGVRARITYDDGRLSESYRAICKIVTPA